MTNQTIDQVTDTFDKCTKCGKKSQLGNGLCINCWDSKNLYPRQNPSQKPKPTPSRAVTWVDKSVDSQEGITLIDKNGEGYRVQSGRKQLGKWVPCVDCGKPNFTLKC